jgi:hypothetical protein
MADEFYDKTKNCTMEVKIIGPDALEEDASCVWLMENKQRVINKCKNCNALFELLKEASLGNFDLQ